jgi:hypothetical protein
MLTNSMKNPTPLPDNVMDFVLDEIVSAENVTIETVKKMDVIFNSFFEESILDESGNLGFIIARQDNRTGEIDNITGEVLDIINCGCAFLALLSINPNTDLWIYCINHDDNESTIH